jgi:hypothetical protein
MANVNAFIQTFSGGEFGDAMSARVGIEAYQSSCEVMENWFPSAQGPMTRRPSLGYIDSFTNSDLKGILKSFQFDVNQNYLLLITSSGIEFFLNDGKLNTDEITATLPNGTFSNFTSWSDASDSGSSADATGGVMRMLSNGASQSKARTSFTVNEIGDTHVLRFEVLHGPVNLRIGSSAGGSQFLDEMELRTGTHFMSFVPTGATCHIEFWFKEDGAKYLDNMSILSGPSYIIPTQWAEEDLRGIYGGQDGDRLFLCHRDYRNRVLERRAHRSWSLIYFEPDDGPFDEGDGTIQMSVSERTGEITVTASRAYFQSSDLRRLLRITHPGQYTKMVANSDAVYGEPVKVVGVGRDRSFSIALTGTWTGTVTLERSVGNLNQFTAVLNYTANEAVTYNDSFDDADAETAGTHDDALRDATDDDVDGIMNNQTIYYRFVVLPGNWTSGTVTATITYKGGGSTVGVARLTNILSTTQANANVIEHFSKVGASDVWDIGCWGFDGSEHPNVVAFSSGRLWLARRRRLWASAPDDYFSFQDGSNDDHSIDITIRSRSNEGIRWMRHLDFLCVGTRNEEYVIRPGTVAEPISPSNTDPGLMSEEGGLGIEAQVGGDSIIFIHRSGRRVMQFVHNPRALTESSFISVDLNRLNPETVEDGVVNIAIQQEPERRIYAVVQSGQVKCSLFRREEEIVAWNTMRTQNGFIEDVCIFTEADVDAVYFIVRRRIGETYVRMIERLNNEVIVNDEDLVHLDSMLETEISRPEAILTFDARMAGEVVTIDASQGVFSLADEGKILWADNGRIRIDTYNSVFQIEGTILNDLQGEQDPDDEDAIVPRPVPPGKWGIAEEISVVNGLDHLEGEEVYVWADKAYFGTAVVTGGIVTLAEPASRIFIGKRMISRWKGLRLAYSAQKGTAVLQQKNVMHLGFILSRTADGLKYGQDFKRMKALILQSSSPVIESGVPYFSGERHEPFNGKFDTDPRLSIKADTPGPATIKALVPNIQVNER